MLKEAIFFICISIYASTCSAVCVNRLEISGGVSEASINDAGVIAAAQFANDFVSEASTRIKNSKYVIVSAKSQVVAGVKYYLNVHYPEEGMNCDFQVVYQSWIEKYSLVDERCFYNDEKLWATRIRPIIPTTID